LRRIAILGCCLVLLSACGRKEEDRRQELVRAQIVTIDRQLKEIGNDRQAMGVNLALLRSSLNDLDLELGRAHARVLAAKAANEYLRELTTVGFGETPGRWILQNPAFTTNLLLLIALLVLALWLCYRFWLRSSEAEALAEVDQVLRRLAAGPVIPAPTRAPKPPAVSASPPAPVAPHNPPAPAPVAAPKPQPENTAPAAPPPAEPAPAPVAPAPTPAARPKKETKTEPPAPAVKSAPPAAEAKAEKPASKRALARRDARKKVVRRSQVKKCKVEGCQNKHRSKGYCNKHYQQWRRSGLPEKEKGQ